MAAQGSGMLRQRAESAKAWSTGSAALRKPSWRDASVKAPKDKATHAVWLESFTASTRGKAQGAKRPSEKEHLVRAARDTPELIRNLQRSEEEKTFEMQRQEDLFEEADGMRRLRHALRLLVLGTRKPSPELSAAATNAELRQLRVLLGQIQRILLARSQREMQKKAQAAPVTEPQLPADKGKVWVRGEGSFLAQVAFPAGKDLSLSNNSGVWQASDEAGGSLARWITGKRARLWLIRLELSPLTGSSQGRSLITNSQIWGQTAIKDYVSAWLSGRSDAGAVLAPLADWVLLDGSSLAKISLALSSKVAVRRDHVETPQWTQPSQQVGGDFLRS
ncbi:hypothetical protein AK812_SmicGene24180 [Symbiodinium microadriaticum]|uniref:Uncharacterized protein n=1 Tax=Symbiodinium microadriaticum TaxID=2951 RepID=A0A1Q9DFF3_SYMMI|nr:hypothetical protein AK812_SmicGene24180 [Symbiodinium microadriaticum]